MTQRLSTCRIAYAGLGNMGRTYLRAALQSPELIKVAAVYDSCPAILERQQLAPGLALPAETQRVTDFTSLLAERPDLLVITTPTDTHEQLVRQAIMAGVPTAVEKPIVSTLKGAEELFALSARHETPLYALHNMRFHESYTRLHDLAGSQRLGRVLKGVLRRNGPVPVPAHFRNPAAGGGLWDHGIHELNAAVWVFGPPSGIRAHGLKRAQGSGRWDLVQASLQWSNSKMFVPDSELLIDVGWARPQGQPCDIEIHIFLEHGELKFTSDGSTGCLELFGEGGQCERLQTAGPDSYASQQLAVAQAAKNRASCPQLQEESVLESIRLLARIEQQLDGFGEHRMRA